MTASALHSGERADSASNHDTTGVLAQRTGIPEALLRALEARLATRHPTLRLYAVEPLGPDTETTASTTAKGEGYGRPLRLRAYDAGGQTVDLVWRVNAANEFGHDRLADRAANTLLARDDFGRIPRHITALDVGAITQDGQLVSLPAGAELYMLTTYAPGRPYVDDLRRIATSRLATEADLARVDALASFLAKLHVPETKPHAYRRAIRDLIGHGEGIFGMIDGYPVSVPAASPARLRAFEQRCTDWRWKLRAHEGRLSRTHGDFHPFNIVFDGDELHLLDASRGTMGDPADDLTALAINYILFAFDNAGAWATGFAPLWRQLWTTYLRERPDPALLEVAPPFFAWRALVVCNPRFYPKLSTVARDQLLSLAEQTLDAGRLDLASPEAIFGARR